MYQFTQGSEGVASNAVRRVRFWYALLVLVMLAFGIRLFYLQILRYDYYKKVALSGQLKQYEIPASRGIIEVYDGYRTVPLVLNEKRYTLFADPKFIKDHTTAAASIQKIIGGNAGDIEGKLKASSRYSILAKKLPKEQKDKLNDLNIKGIGTRETEVRTYPQGELAAQLLGFVDDEGNGKYGIEQFLDKALQGSAGQLRAITDARGVPLVANSDNVVIKPVPGQRVGLTLDLSMQRQLEDALKAGLDKAESKSGSALIMDPNTGAVKAMANYPTYNPAEFYKVEDGNIFNNSTVSSPLEVGSIMKPLTAAAALNQGVVNKNTTYHDPSRIVIGDAVVSNIEEDGGPGTRSVADILQMSLNTGAVYLLQQMGGGELNKNGRLTWHDYMANRYHLGKPTGIEQGYEAGGFVPDPNEGFGLNIQYANTSFGQGMTATPLQMGAALSSIINGGTYYRPRLVERTTDSKDKTTVKQPDIVRKDVIGASVSRDMRELMKNVVDKNYLTYSMKRPDDRYVIGGKTGTAEVPKPGGGYYDDRFNGTFMGFIGGDSPQYAIVVRVNEPKIKGYAGSKAAAPIFGSITEFLINNFNMTPKGQ